MFSNLLLFGAGLITGMLIWALIKKEKQKRRFNIENQMLKDQNEILELQKKIAELEAEKKQFVCQIAELKNVSQTVSKA